MYLMPLAMMIQTGDPASMGLGVITWRGMAANLVPVIAGNLVGGSVLVGLAYHVIYRRGQPAATPTGAAEPPKPPTL
jgi:formate/nitrite transporter FocA (FNT family)